MGTLARFPSMMAAIAMAGIGLGAAVPAQAQTFDWNFANAYSPGEFLSEEMQGFADRLRDRSNGAINIEMHHAGSLFPNTEILQATRSGFVQLGTQLMTNLGRENALWEVDGIPFLVNSYEEGKLLWEVSRPRLEALLAESGLRLLYAAPWPSQGFFFDREVNTLADIRGLPKRAYNPSTTRLAELMGTTPTTVQITEMPQAFATGLIRGLNTSPTTGVLYTAWEYTTHFYNANAWLPKQMIFMREDAFQSLPVELQALVLEEAAIAEARTWERSEELVSTAVATLAENGMTIVVPSGQLAEEFAAIGETMLSEWLANADAEAAEVVAEFQRRKAE
jgi:TRAP-type C4-dicarboxylate transport system substrate-binding protein